MSPRAVIPFCGLLLIAVSLIWGCQGRGGAAPPSTAPGASPPATSDASPAPQPAMSGGVLVGSEEHASIVDAARRWSEAFGDYDYRLFHLYQPRLIALSTGTLRAALEHLELAPPPYEEAVSMPTVHAVEVRSTSAGTAIVHVALLSQRAWVEQGVRQHWDVLMSIDLDLVRRDAGWLASRAVIDGEVWLNAE